jgi:hypothetical protein
MISDHHNDEKNILNLTIIQTLNPISSDGDEKLLIIGLCFYYDIFYHNYVK